ncbi:MAG: hypothetical protein GTN78_19885 [Gemmatimonadales bacterium]|nr:hypothetical protein [Gemmatimonadales bacterium]NIN12635.1 hypothetical protein [Gemmatimonadales bacterium]NIR02428.1 hypothetical protein [Gemmatimonadales bacterium]NIS66219.1 hypothetical protein [Gemmatimonadales bacterium]
MKQLTILGLFLVAVVVMTAVSVFGRASVQYTPAMQNALVVVGALLIATAGWVSVSRFGYELRWAPVIGLVLSFGSHWSLFVVHEFPEIPPLVLVNSAIFAAVASLGGAAAVVYRKFRQRRLRKDDSTS